MRPSLARKQDDGPGSVFAFLASQPFQPYTLIQSTSAQVGADAAFSDPAHETLLDPQMLRRIFSGSLSREMLAVSIQRVLQQAFANVDESGTEAAAVTAVADHTGSHGNSPTKPIAFHADHPFLYVIRDRTTGVVLFIGRVVDPAAGAQ